MFLYTIVSHFCKFEINPLPYITDAGLIVFKILLLVYIFLFYFFILSELLLVYNPPRASRCRSVGGPQGSKPKLRPHFSAVGLTSCLRTWWLCSLQRFLRKKKVKMSLQLSLQFVVFFIFPHTSTGFHGLFSPCLFDVIGLLL